MATTTVSILKLILLDEDGYAIGHSDSIIGCCRKISAAIVEDLTWQEVRERLELCPDGSQRIIVQIVGEPAPAEISIVGRNEVEDLLRDV